jgi:predicted nucleotidyltransferase component of viral defense system
MLHTESIERHTLGILVRLMQIEELKNFDLVGGTALTLRYGHRLSVDLDLFATVQFDNNTVLQAVNNVYPDFQPTNIFNKVGLFGFIEGVKIDLVQYYKYEVIGERQEENGIRILSDADIAAMKIFAILQRARKKDMYDISLLLDEYGLEKIIGWYFEKFPRNQMLISIPTALQYFIDTEEDDDPVSLTNQTWIAVKRNISRHVNKFLK